MNLWLQQPLTPLAQSLWRRWTAQSYQVVAPLLFCYEVTAVFRKTVYQGVITVEKGAEGLREVLRLPIDYLSPPDLHTRAYDLATRLGRPTAYDAHYLVVAQTVGCEFWTADQKLVHAVSDTFPWVRFLGDYSPPESPTTA